MVIYVACWPLLAWLAGQLIPAIGAGNFPVVLRTIAAALGLFLVQKAAQFGHPLGRARPAG